MFVFLLCYSHALLAELLAVRLGVLVDLADPMPRGVILSCFKLFEGDCPLTCLLIWMRSEPPAKFRRLF